MSELEPRKNYNVKKGLDDSDDWWLKGTVISGAGTVAFGAIGVILNFLPVLHVFTGMAFGAAGLTLFMTLVFLVIGIVKNR